MLSSLASAFSRAEDNEPSQVITLPTAKSQTRKKDDKDMPKGGSVYSELGVALHIFSSGGE
jgi:hypothetical protein